MKTILCPVDFSKSAQRVAEYAARIAHDNKAKVVLVATNPRFDQVPAGDWDGKQEVVEHLGEWHDWINSRFHVPCTVAKEIILDNVYKKISILSDHYDMMILGSSNGRSAKIQPSVGLDVVKSIRETLAPTFIVPEKCEYKKVKRLLYAYDYHQEPDPPMLQLRWLADWFGAEVKFISILPGEIPVNEEDKLHLIEDKIGHQWSPGKKLSFETIIYHNVARCLEHYLSLWEMNDLLVLSVNHRSTAEKIWHKSVVKQLLKYGTHPYLILHK